MGFVLFFSLKVWQCASVTLSGMGVWDHPGYCITRLLNLIWSMTVSQTSCFVFFFDDLQHFEIKFLNRISLSLDLLELKKTP